MRRWNRGIGPVVLGALAVLTLVTLGCKSSKQLEDFPDTVEAVVEAAPSEPDSIDYLDVNPWSLAPGESAAVTLKGTADRTAKVTLEGLEGEAAGKSVSIDMKPGDAGSYSGTVTAGENLPPGKYRLAAELMGGPTGEPTRLVSSRALTIAAPPPPPDPCVELARSLTTPRIHFAFDKSEISAEGQAYIASLAGRLREAASRVSGVTVEGHCDERGSIEYNLALGARRALAVKDALLAEPGMAGLNVRTLSRGEEQPIVSGARTEEEHAQNRRAVILLECAAR